MTEPTSPRVLKIGGATLNQTPLDWQNNSSNIINAINLAREQQVDILCLPELCITGYGCEDLFLSDWLSAKAWEKLQEIKQYCTNLIACIGLPVRINGYTYNGVAVVDNQKIIGITLKQFLAKDGVHYEPRWFEEWKAGEIQLHNFQNEIYEVGDIVYEAHGIRFGFEICEDAWRKNRTGYNLYKRGVHLILNPSASHFALGKSPSREALVTNASCDFNCAYVYVNHLGNEAGRMIYDGDIIMAQYGKMIAQNHRLSMKPVNLLVASINFSTSGTTEILPLTDNKERHEEFTQAVSLALFDYLRKSKAKGFALSLSGGADSAACAVLVAEMIKRATKELGWNAFCEALAIKREELNDDIRAATAKLLACAYQATANSSEITFNAARTLAESIGAEFHHWSIQEEVESYTRKMETALQRKLTWETDDITLQNIQARARSPIIWMLANTRRAVLLTTSNRSEGDVGYATMDGDTSGSLAPIAGIDKPFIRQWLMWAQQKLGYAGLHYVNEQQPTAELRPAGSHQTDETDLMPYAILVEIERHAIRDRKSPVEVFNAMKTTSNDALLKNHIKKFFSLWAANQWKRERLAPSFHLDEINVDPRSWCRFPILSSAFKEELETLDRL